MKKYPCEKVDVSFFERAPIRFINSVNIHAAPEKVFAAFEDENSWPTWASPITKVIWTSPRPFGIGTTRTVEMIGGMVGYEEFIVWDPNQRMAFRFNDTSMESVCAFAEDYRVDIRPNGCQVTWTMAMQPTGVSKFLLPLMRKPMEMYFGKLLCRFKSVVENGQFTPCASTCNGGPP